MSMEVSPEMARLRNAVERSGFAFPHCSDCDQLHYPPQSCCPHCLSSNVSYEPDSAHATVLSTVALHRSFDAEWKPRLPTHVACALTDSGLKLFAMSECDVPANTPVSLRWLNGLLHVSIRLDR